MNTTLTHVVMYMCMFIYNLYSISHSILTMICIFCFILIDLGTEEGITVNLLVTVLIIAILVILQASASTAMSAAALRLTRTLIKVDADASQIKILFVHMRNPALLILLATDAPTLIL
jgi:hypothetical protein